jgi:hypothetical protein
MHRPLQVSAFAIGKAIYRLNCKIVILAEQIGQQVRLVR